MNDRLSFYRQRNSSFHAFNPSTKMFVSFGLILIGLFAPGYWTATFVVLLVLFPLSMISRLFQDYFGIVTRLVLPTAGFMFVMQSIFLPGGTTEIFKVGPITIELETVIGAFLTASRVFLMISAFTFLLLTTHPSELMTDLRKRGLPSQFAYVFISTLQIIPQMQAKAQTIIAAQRSRGLDTESTLVKRVAFLLPLAGPLVFGSLVEVEERAIAIEARGFTSKKTKTSLHEIPDRPTDRLIRWITIILVIVSIASRIWLS